MTIKATALGLALLASLPLAFAEEAAAPKALPPEPEVLRDMDKTQWGRVDGMHQVRYIEVFLAGFEAKTGKLVAACYNPMYLEGGIPESKDTAPQALVEGIDFDKLKQEYALVGASLNGPKIWTPDWSEAEIGPVRDFNGIKAPWVCQLELKKGGAVADVTAYEPMTVFRKSKIGWNKGTTVMILDDAEGNSWVMKGFQLGMQPKYTYAEFMAAGQANFKKLPEGWKFRVVTLEKDLIETLNNEGGAIMADEFFNVYDQINGGQMNYVP
jgi:hypothetical protein